MSESNQMEGLSCNGVYPLSWSVINEVQDKSFDQFQSINLARLRTIQNLEETGRELLDEHGEVAQELRRIDFKVNIILEMVSQLVVREMNMPEAVAVTLRADSMSWQINSGAPDVGAHLKITLYLDERFPFPLILYGSVAGLDNDWVRLEFDVMDASFQDIFEKYVFRCHRRQIARLKREASD